MELVACLSSLTATSSAASDEPQAASGGAVVSHLGRFVHGPSDAVATTRNDDYFFFQSIYHWLSLP